MGRDREAVIPLAARAGHTTNVRFLVSPSQSGSSQIHPNSAIQIATRQWLVWVLGWTAPDGIDCARMRSLQISNKGDRPWNRLAELAWIHRNIFSSFMG